MGQQVSCSGILVELLAHVDLSLALLLALSPIDAVRVGLTCQLAFRRVADRRLAALCAETELHRLELAPLTLERSLPLSTQTAFSEAYRFWLMCELERPLRQALAREAHEVTLYSSEPLLDEERGGTEEGDGERGCSEEARGMPRCRGRRFEPGPSGVWTFERLHLRWVR